MRISNRSSTNRCIRHRHLPVPQVCHGARDRRARPAVGDDPGSSFGDASTERYGAPVARYSAARADAHPTFVLIQGQALFPVDGAFAFVRNHVHLHSTYLSAFATCGLRLLRCDEPPMQVDWSKGLFAGAAEAADALWSGIPIALVWTLAHP